jgi:hypothetical protein
MLTRPMRKRDRSRAEREMRAIRSLLNLGFTPSEIRRTLRIGWATYYRRRAELEAFEDSKGPEADDR